MTQQEKNAWDIWDEKARLHAIKMEAKRPKWDSFTTPQAYERAMAEWNREYHCDAPEKPGQEFANND